jgi:hypothetical protein
MIVNGDADTPVLRLFVFLDANAAAAEHGTANAHVIERADDSTAITPLPSTRVAPAITPLPSTPVAPSYRSTLESPLRERVG